MDSSTDEKGLGHNRRDKNSKASADVFFARAIKSLKLHPEFEYLDKWGVEWSDPQFKDIAKRLYGIWPRLSAEDRELYLRTAESIAEAEKAKSAWNPKAMRDQYTRLSKTAVAAARLANELGAMFPPPWTGERAPMGDLMQGLASFVAGSLHATFPKDRDTAVHTARFLLQTTRRSVSRKGRGMHWELIRDLAWLASQKKARPDERTVRRYLDEGRHVKTPAQARWEGNWDLIRNAFRLAPNGPREPFEKLVKRYLKTPIVSDTSAEQAARKRH